MVAARALAAPSINQVAYAAPATVAAAPVYNQVAYAAAAPVAAAPVVAAPVAAAPTNIAAAYNQLAASYGYAPAAAYNNQVRAKIRKFSRNYVIYS